MFGYQLLSATDQIESNQIDFVYGTTRTTFSLLLSGNGTQTIQVTQNVVKVRCSSQNICNTKTPLGNYGMFYDNNLPVASCEPQESDILGTL